MTVLQIRGYIRQHPKNMKLQNLIDIFDRKILHYKFATALGIKAVYTPDNKAANHEFETKPISVNHEPTVSDAEAITLTLGGDKVSDQQAQGRQRRNKTPDTKAQEAGVISPKTRE